MGHSIPIRFPTGFPITCGGPDSHVPTLTCANCATNGVPLPGRSFYYRAAACPQSTIVDALSQGAVISEIKVDKFRRTALAHGDGKNPKQHPDRKQEPAGRSRQRCTQPRIGVKSMSEEKQDDDQKRERIALNRKQGRIERPRQWPGKDPQRGGEIGRTKENPRQRDEVKR